MMALVTQRVIVVLLCTLSQCSAAGTVRFSSGSESQIVMEGGSLSVCVMATLDPGDSVELELSGTPAGGLDVPTNTLHLTDTTTTDCWMVTATDDNIYEVDSQIFTLNLVLVNPTSSDIVLTDPSTANITVIDDEEVIVVFTNSAGPNLEAVTVVDEGQSVEVCVSVSGATISEREVVVQVATSELQDDPKAATSNMDYEHFTMDATFTSTVSQVCEISVLTEIDLIYENFEVFRVSLSIDANPRIRLGTQKTIRIRDGQRAVISLVNPTIVQNEGDGDVSVCARLDSPVGGTEREIFITLNSNGFTFPSNSRVGATRCLTIPVTNNNVYQISPVLMQTVTLSKYPMALNQGRLDLGNTVATVTINDDDDVVVSMTTPTMTTTEGGVVDVCANLVSPSGGTSVPITVVFTWSGGSSTVTFSANSNANTRACIQLTVADDDIYGTSPIPVYTVVLSSPNSRVTVGTRSQTTITVRDDDDVTIEMKNAILSQNEGDDDVTVCAILTGPPSGLGQSVTVQFTAPANLSPNGQLTLTFPSRAALLSEQCITYNDPVSDDELFETTSPLASFVVTLSANQDRVTATGTTTINVYDDDDAELALQNTLYNLQEATNETGQICVMLMQPAGGLANPVQVDFTISTTNVLSPATRDVDYTVDGLLQTNTRLVSPECITVTIVDDIRADPGESFRVQVSTSNANRVSFSNGLSEATINIINDDVLPGPTNLRSVSTSSTSVTLAWDAPDSSSFSTPLVSYTITTLGSNVQRTVTSVQLQYTIRQLVPFQEYQFSVHANFVDGRSDFVSINGRTLEDVPGGPPTMLMASPTATTLTLSWDTPAEPNGVIITYTLYVDYRNGTITNFPTPSAPFLLSPLRPYQTVSAQVSASTSVGEGPRTFSIEFTTAEAKSGPVGNLRVLRVNETTFTVNWIAPAVVNGVLLTYTIRTSEEGSSSAVTEYNTSATSFSIHELVPYTPYVVSVAAINGAGAGEPVSVVEFTAEGIPLIHPRDIGSTRLNGTAVRVSWRPLSRSEARGFITNYTITYWRVGSNAANASAITVSGEDASSALIIKLDPNSDYYFTVSAGTVQGVGNVSVAMVILTQSSGMVGVIAGAVVGLIVAVVLLIIIVCIACIIRRRQHGGPKQESASRNPAYGMSVRQAPNDAVNVQSNDEHTYEHVRDIRVDEVVYETIDPDKNSGEGEAVMVSSNGAYGVRL